VPGIAWMPGRVKAGITRELAHAMDLFPTALALAGAAQPKDVVLDGTDLSPVLFEGHSLPPRAFFYYRGDQLFACRLGEWKAHFKTQTGYGRPTPEVHDTPLLFHLGRDPSEKRNIAADHADILTQIQQAVKAHQATVVPGTPQLQ
jgi:arylsulfatase A-like enzyme